VQVKGPLPPAAWLALGVVWLTAAAGQPPVEVVIFWTAVLPALCLLHVAEPPQTQSQLAAASLPPDAPAPARSFATVEAAVSRAAGCGQAAVHRPAHQGQRAGAGGGTTMQ
jgi:hypothetical protein